MKILIVGAGCVGQVFGYHLQRAGAEVSFWVRPKYVEECKRGFVLYSHNGRGLREPIRFQAASILSTLEELERERFDQVYLCIPSNGLRGEWFARFADRLGDAVLVSLCPGIDDRAYIAEHFDPARTVTGLITQISYPAPLPGEQVGEPGTAYWFPPMGPHPFDGPPELVRAVVALLRKGRLPARADFKLAEKAGYPNVVLMMFIIGLEAAGWSFDAVKQPASMQRIHAAMREGLAYVSRRQGTRPPLAFRMLGPLTMRLALGVAPAVIPFDLETYLKVHFTKVGGQTRMFVDDWTRGMRELGVASTNLETLAKALA